MHLRWAVVLGVLAFLAPAASSASARSSEILTLRPGDYVHLVGTKIACGVSAAKPGGQHRGTTIACALEQVRGAKLVPSPQFRSNEVTMSARGVSWAEVYRLVEYRPQRLLGVYHLDVVRVSGTRIVCVFFSRFSRKVACWIEGSKGALPGSYGFSFDANGVIEVLRYDASHKGKVVRRIE